MINDGVFIRQSDEEKIKNNDGIFEKKTNTNSYKNHVQNLKENRDA
jgi:hypothetical protein